MRGQDQGSAFRANKMAIEQSGEGPRSESKKLSHSNKAGPF